MCSVIPPSGRIQLLQERSKALNSTEKGFKMKAKANYFSLQLCVCHYERYQWKYISQNICTVCAGKIIRSLSLDSGVGLRLHNFRYLHCLFVHFLLDRRLSKHLWNSKMWFASSALNVYLRMRWVVFLAAGGEGNWQGKFRQAHSISSGYWECRHSCKEGHFRNPLPLPPALDLEKLCRSGGESISLTMSLHDLWEAAVRASASTRCPLLPKALQTAPWGGGDWSHGLLSSWCALCLHPGSTDHLSSTVQTISPSFFQFLPFLLSEELKSQNRWYFLWGGHNHQDPNWNKQLLPRWEHFNDRLL